MQPGDKVRVIRDGYEPEDIYVIVSVTANSVGEVISFAEYRSYIMRNNRGYEESDGVQQYLLRVEKDIQQGNSLPVKINEFAPMSETVYEFWANQGYKRDGVKFWPDQIALIDVQSLEKII